MPVTVKQPEPQWLMISKLLEVRTTSATITVLPLIICGSLPLSGNSIEEWPGPGRHSRKGDSVACVTEAA
jgi:hypothetical protein